MDFKDQVKDLLTGEQIEQTILNGCYSSHHNHKGEIKWCPNCQKIRQTSCCACGCGNCKICNYRWCCGQPPLYSTNIIFPVNSNMI